MSSILLSQSGRSVEGKLAGSLETSSHHYAGLAISADGLLLATISYYFPAVHTYALPSCTPLHTFGAEGAAPGQFNRAYKACFTSGGHLLIAESFNKRVQELLPDGTPCRVIGAGVIAAPLRGLAANDAVVVAGVSGAVEPVLCMLYVFDYSTGSLLRQFGPEATQVTPRIPGHLFECHGLRIMPDGGHIAVVDINLDCVSIFTLSGSFVREVAGSPLAGPRDVDFASNGDIIVPENNNRVKILCPQSGEVLRTVARAAGDATPAATYSFANPTAIAVHNGELYVASQLSNIIHVFE